MIRKLKVQLSKSPHTLALCLLLPLGGFFAYNWRFAPQFFWYLAGSIAIGIVYLFYSYFELARERSEISLRQNELEEQLNLIQASLHREQQACESLKCKIKNYALLKNLTESLSATFSLTDTATALLKDLSSLFSQRGITAIVYRFHAGAQHLSLLSSLQDGEVIHLKAKKGDEYDAWVMKHLKPLLVEDTKSDFRFDVEEMIGEDQRPVRSLMIVPLIVAEKPVGLLRIDHLQDRQFATDDLRFLNTVGSLGAVALENAVLYEQVEDLAIRDSLTGVYLRRFGMERLTQEINRHARRDGLLSFLMIDLDDFKKYNDQYGHTAGDIVLKTMALLLTDMFHDPGQMVCRYGGEEFCVFLPDCSVEQAEHLAEQLRQRIESQVVILRRERTKFTVSIGVAGFPQQGKSKEELLQAADQALYQAKAKGRNRVVRA